VGKHGNLVRHCGTKQIRLNRSLLFPCNCLLPSSFQNNIEVSKKEIIFDLKTQGLPFTDKVDIFYTSSNWVEMKLHTKNELPWLPRTVLIVNILSVVVWWFSFDNNTVQSPEKDPIFLTSYLGKLSSSYF
jgi:hypothetical protein